MIYQIHFTIALELIALALGALLLIKSSQTDSYRLFTKLVGYFLVGMSITLLLSTGYFLYFAKKAKSTQSAPVQKQKLRMVTNPSGRSKGGYVKPTPAPTQKGIPINLKNMGSGIHLPPMTVKKKTVSP